MLRAASRGQPLRVVSDQVGSPTWTGHLAPALLRLIERDVPGTYHLTNCGRGELARVRPGDLRDRRRRARVAPITTADWPTPAPRPGLLGARQPRVAPARRSPAAGLARGAGARTSPLLATSGRRARSAPPPAEDRPCPTARRLTPRPPVSRPAAHRGPALRRGGGRRRRERHAPARPCAVRRGWDGRGVDDDRVRRGDLEQRLRSPARSATATVEVRRFPVAACGRRHGCLHALSTGCLPPPPASASRAPVGDRAGSVLAGVDPRAGTARDAGPDAVLALPVPSDALRRRRRAPPAHPRARGPRRAGAAARVCPPRPALGGCAVVPQPRGTRAGGERSTRGRARCRRRAASSGSTLPTPSTTAPSPRARASPARTSTRAAGPPAARGRRCSSRPAGSCPRRTRGHAGAERRGG